MLSLIERLYIVSFILFKGPLLVVPLYVVCGRHGFSSDVCTVHRYLVHDLFHYFLMI